MKTEVQRYMSNYNFHLLLININNRCPEYLGLLQEKRTFLGTFSHEDGHLMVRKWSWEGNER